MLLSATWRLNVSYSRNLDDRLRRRLTTIFVTEVKKLGPGTYPLFNLADVQGETYLPQVSLFDNRAAAWLHQPPMMDLATC